MKQSQLGIGVSLVAVFVLCIVFTPVTVAADSHTTNTTGEVIEPTADQQFATIVESAFANIEGEVDDARRNVAIEKASNSAERAEVLKEQADELNESSREIAEEYREAAREREQGEISQEAFAQRVAVLNTRAERARSGITRVERLTAELPQAALDNAQITQSQLEDANESINVVASNGASVIREKFTGNNDIANLSVQGNERGLSVAAEASDGRVFRGVEREADDDGSYSITEQEALALARSELSGGNWSVSESEADDGNYEFEFEKTSNQSSGQAELTVDASSGQVIESEMSERRGPPENAGGPPDTFPGAGNGNGNENGENQSRGSSDSEDEQEESEDEQEEETEDEQQEDEQEESEDEQEEETEDEQQEDEQKESEDETEDEQQEDEREEESEKTPAR